MTRPGDREGSPEVPDFSHDQERVRGASCRQQQKVDVQPVPGDPAIAVSRWPGPAGAGRATDRLGVLRPIHYHYALAVPDLVIALIVDSMQPVKERSLEIAEAEAGQAHYEGEALAGRIAAHAIEFCDVRGQLGRQG
jgi:hypothetical protein